jgi:hypothetical protein
MEKITFKHFWFLALELGWIFQLTGIHELGYVVLSIATLLPFLINSKTRRQATEEDLNQEKFGFKGISPFFQNLTVVFVALKLMNYIDWTWITVLSPVLIHLGLQFILFLIIKLNLATQEK